MERGNHEPIPSQEIPIHENEESLESELADQEAGVVLDQAVEEAAEIFQEIETIESTANPPERVRLQRVKKQASLALTTLYKKLRKLALPVTLLVGGGYIAHAQYNKKEDTHYNDKQHLDRGQLSPAMAVVDTYISSDLVDTYNKCVDFLHNRKDGQMSKEEIDFKEKMAQNMMPTNYGIPIVTDLMRLHQIKSGSSGKDAEYSKESLSQSNPTGFFNNLIYSEGSKLDTKMGTDQAEKYRVRIDMFRKYLGLDQYFDSVQPAEYKPSQAKEAQAKYFQFNSQDILKNMFQNFKDQSFEGVAKFVQKHNRIPKNAYTGQLGEYKAYIGFDKERNEEYVSYYDVWDMEPPQLKALGISVDQFNFPYEIYGRIYKSDVDKYLADNK